ncbi:histidine kinase dimerization/phospho-acceptor domain-containing protein [Actinomadura keratinilytica]
MFLIAEHPAAVDHLPARRPGRARRQRAAVPGHQRHVHDLQRRLPGPLRPPLHQLGRLQRRDEALHRPPAPAGPGRSAEPLAAGPGRSQRDRLRLRLRHGRTGPRAAGPDHPDRAQRGYSDLSRRIELDGPDDELKELADTFDDMLDRLERAFTAQQRFVANASHELRTPLAINRTLLEVQLSDPGAPPSSSSSARPCSPPTSGASNWSRACSCWPAATTRSSSASRWTSARSPPAPSSRCAARPSSGRWSCARTSPRRSSRATASCWSGSP